MSEVRRLDKSDADASAQSLADAFADDPLMGWAGHFEDDPKRLTPVFRSAIAARFRHPEPLMFTTENHEATALWNAPEHTELTSSELFRSLPAIVRSFRFGIVRLARLLQIVDQAHPSEPHYYLFAIGVRRDAQGSGLGSSVIQPMLDRCDEEGLPAYLENSKPRNEAFYVRHGFKPRAPIELPAGAPPFMPMWRDPR